MSNIVFMIDYAHDQRSNDQGYEQSIYSWRHWCKKNNAELFILNDLLFPLDKMKLTWQRYYIFDLLENNNQEYDQICMVDADTIIHPDAPNFFNLTENKYCAVINPIGEWVLRSMEVYKKTLFQDINLTYDRYFNAGFQVINKSHKDFFKEMINFYWNNQENLLYLQNTVKAGSDQTPWNFMLKKHNIETKELSYKWNMQELERHHLLNELLYTRVGYIYHFNTWPKPNPKAWMTDTIKMLGI